MQATEILAIQVVSFDEASRGVLLQINAFRSDTRANVVVQNTVANARVVEVIVISTNVDTLTISSLSDSSVGDVAADDKVVVRSVADVNSFHSSFIDTNAVDSAPLGLVHLNALVTVGQSHAHDVDEERVGDLDDGRAADASIVDDSVARTAQGDGLGR